MQDDIWCQFKDKFMHILKDKYINDYYYKLYNFLQNHENNVLMYGTLGFPTDLFIDEVIKAKFDLSVLHKTTCNWPCRNASNKDMVYFHNPHFLEINLMHHSVEKNASELSKFFTDIIKNRNINTGHKHFIIIKHIDLLEAEHFTSYRIILERFSNNAYFLCTAHNIARIDMPIKSRFSLMRVPLFTNSEIMHIFDKHMKIECNSCDKKNRNIMKALYFFDINNDKASILLNFPPITDLFKVHNRHITLDKIRQLSYKCFQYDVSIPQLLDDILKLLPKNITRAKLTRIISAAASIEHKLQLTKIGREPIYIEAFLCEVFL